MKKTLMLFLIILFFMAVMGCNQTGTVETTTITTTTQTQTTTTNSTMTNTLRIGTQMHYSFELMTSLWERYDFRGDTYYIFEINFPQDVNVIYDIRSFLDEYDFVDREKVIVQSDGIGELTIFEYVIAELEKTLTYARVLDEMERYSSFMDEEGNILRVKYISDTEVEIKLERGVNIFFQENDEGYQGYFCFSLGSVALDLEASRNLIVDGCPSCVVSDIVDGAYTYTYLGETFMIPEEGAILIEGYYHFQVTHVEEE